jgi:nicotinamide-nucleotide amidase
MATDLARLHLELQRIGATVAVAESLTGGLVLAALTETPGASLSVRGGLVVYATDLKAQLAGVDADLLAERGAVDPDVALALARGVRDRLGASIGLGVTGVAGPDPQDGQPVGTVFAATSSARSEQVSSWTFPGDRRAIREAAVQACVGLLEAVVSELARAARESSG